MARLLGEPPRRGGSRSPPLGRRCGSHAENLFTRPELAQGYCRGKHYPVGLNLNTCLYLLNPSALSSSLQDLHECESRLLEADGHLAGLGCGKEPS